MRIIPLAFELAMEDTAFALKRLEVLGPSEFSGTNARPLESAASTEQIWSRSKF